MQPERVLVIDVSHLHDNKAHTNKYTDLSRYPNPIVCKGWVPDRGMLKHFLTGLDVVFSAETFYAPQFSDLAHRCKVRTALQCNPEFLNRRDMPDLWIPPTRWMWDTIPEPKTLLPVPIATGRFAVRDDFPAARPATHFTHIVGRPAVHDRNGTTDLLKALQFVKSEVTVTVRCQQPGYVSGLVHQHRIKTPANVTLRLDSADVPHYWDNYAGDVLVMPRRFGGLCLPVNEALGAGMPAIMPAIEPNTDWLPSEWLVPAVKQGSFMCKQRVDYYSVDVLELAHTIDRFASQPDLYVKARDEASRLRDEYSWDTLKPRYLEVLGDV